MCDLNVERAERYAKACGFKWDDRGDYTFLEKRVDGKLIDYYHSDTLPLEVNFWFPLLWEYADKHESHDVLVDKLLFFNNIILESMKSGFSVGEVCLNLCISIEKLENL